MQGSLKHKFFASSRNYHGVEVASIPETFITGESQLGSQRIPPFPVRR